MLNNITVMGRLTKDVELKNAGEHKVVNNTVAVARDYAPEGQPDTDFIDIAVWDRAAERMAKNLKKGAMVVVRGRLEINSYTDKEGKSRNAASIRVSDWYFGEPKAKTENAAEEDAPDVGGEVDFPF